MRAYRLNRFPPDRTHAAPWGWSWALGLNRDQEVEHHVEGHGNDHDEVPVDGRSLRGLMPNHRQVTSGGPNENQEEEDHASDHVGQRHPGHDVEERRVGKEWIPNSIWE